MPRFCQPVFVVLALCLLLVHAPCLAVAQAKSSEGVIKSQRLAAGVPLGGVGSGGFQLQTDGTFSDAWFADIGSTPGPLPGSFLALWTQRDGNSQARVLALRNDYGLPVASELEFEGLYPQARLAYPRLGLPVTVGITAFSPLQPFDLASSALPGAVFVLQIRNPEPTPVEISVALSWEHRTGSAVGPLPAAEGLFTQRLAGEASEVQLVALPPKEGRVTFAGWDARAAQPGWWDAFARSGELTGGVPAGGAPAGALAVRLTLRASGYAEIPFAVTWHTPRRKLPDGNETETYAARYYPTASATARALLSEWRSLYSLTEEWQKRLLFSNLPAWMSRRLIDSTSVLTTHAVLTRDGSLVWRNRPGIPDAATPETILAAAPLAMAFFPGLQARQIADALPTLAQTDTGPMPQPPRLPVRTLAELNTLLIRAALYAQWTGDTSFLIANTLPLSRLLTPRLAEVGPNGLPAMEADTPRQASLWIAALRAAESLNRYALQAVREVRAARKGASPNAPPLPDTLGNEAEDNARRLQEAAERAEAGFRTRFGNGKATSDPGSLLGLWPIRLLDLPTTLPAPEITMLLRDLQAREELPTANRTEYDLVASLPGQAWLTIASGQPEAGVKLWNRLDTIRTERLRAPWQSPDRFLANPPPSHATPPPGLAHAADWSLLYALQGFGWNAFTGELTLTPQIPGTWRRLSAPVFAAGLWARLDYTPSVRGGRVTFRVDRLVPIVPASPLSGLTGNRAALTVRTVRVPGPPNRAATSNASVSAHASRGTQALGATVAALPDGSLRLTFDTPVALSAGDRLEIDVP